MTEVVHADIFFFITAIVVLVVGVGAAIIACYVILILRDVRAMVRKVRKASDEIEEDFEALRATIKNEGMRVRSIVELLLGFLLRRASKPRAKKKDKAVEVEIEADID
jgi:hypothetical protein